jgi:hypothetical protein
MIYPPPDDRRNNQRDREDQNAFSIRNRQNTGQ